MLGLSGPSIHSDIPPETCPQCGCKHFYKQHDFKRSIGVSIVVTASIISFALMGLGFNWFTFMSPMVVALIIDRVFAANRPFAAVCYDCALIVRGLSKEKLEAIPDFDLEVFDRIHYPKRTQGEQPID